MAANAAFTASDALESGPLRAKVAFMLLTNARIYTLDAHDSVADSLLIRDGRVAFVGPRDAINLPAGIDVVDVGGRAIIPGLVDGHAHLMGLAHVRLTLDVTSSTSERDAADTVATARARRGDWVVGRGWNHHRWPEPRLPSCASLDAVAPDHPVRLRRIDGHASWVNSAALSRAGIDAHTRDPVGGLIVRDRAGVATGLLIDTAMELVERAVPSPTAQSFDDALDDAIDECLAHGLTGVHEMGVDRFALDAYERLHARGRFRLRNTVAVAGDAADAWDHCRERGPYTLGDERIRVSAFKLLLDGALGSCGAALHEPYCTDPETTGLVLIPPAELPRLIEEATRARFQVCVHAIGDRANTLLLDAYEAAAARLPPGDYRFRAEHAQILRDDDVPRFARLGVLPSVQPIHCVSDLPWATAMLGERRARDAYRWRSLLDSGTILAGGSDFPVESPNPFHGLFAAITRRPIDRAEPDPGWSDHECLTRVEALRSLTTWNAFAVHRERDLGALDVGKRADLVVLSDDVLTCPVERIPATRPVLSMIDGEVVFSDGEVAPDPPLTHRGTCETSMS